jgi:hypothetical protein
MQLIRFMILVCLSFLLIGCNSRGPEKIDDNLLFSEKYKDMVIEARRSDSTFSRKEGIYTKLFKKVELTFHSPKQDTVFTLQLLYTDSTVNYSCNQLFGVEKISNDTFLFKIVEMVNYALGYKIEFIKTTNGNVIPNKVTYYMNDKGLCFDCIDTVYKSLDFTCDTCARKTFTCYQTIYSVEPLTYNEPTDYNLTVDISGYKMSTAVISDNKKGNEYWAVLIPGKICERQDLFSHSSIGFDEYKTKEEVLVDFMYDGNDWYIAFTSVEDEPDKWQPNNIKLRRGDTLKLANYMKRTKAGFVLDANLKKELN